MMPTGACRDPVCKACNDNEYTDTYNNEATCEKQPYCDPNKNFKWATRSSKTQRTPCLCLEGFHCSSQTCSTCVSHTVCGPGYGAVTIGDQNHDTVCEKCKEGTFSDQVSWNATCKQMTRCLFGDVTNKGSDVSDNSCVPQSNWHIGVILALALVALALALGVGGFFRHRFYKNKREYTKVTLQKCVENPREDTPEPKSPIVHPTDDVFSPPSLNSYPTSIHSCAMFSSSTPEENEEVVRTDKGFRLSQDGKDHIMSQTETGFDSNYTTNNNSTNITM